MLGAPAWPWPYVLGVEQPLALVDGKATVS